MQQLYGKLLIIADDLMQLLVCTLFFQVNGRGIRPTILVNKILQKQPLVVARLRRIFDRLPEGQQETVATHTELSSASHDCSKDQCPDDSMDHYCSNFPTALMCRDAGLNLADSDMADEPRHPNGAVPTTCNEVLFISASSSGASQGPTQTSDMLSTCENSMLRPKALQQQKSLLERIGNWFQAPKLYRSQSVPTDEERHGGKQHSAVPDALAQPEGWSEEQLPPVAQEHTSEESRTMGDEGFSSEEEVHTLIAGQSPSYNHQSAYSDLVSPQEELAVCECAHGERGAP